MFGCKTGVTSLMLIGGGDVGVVSKTEHAASIKLKAAINIRERNLGMAIVYTPALPLPRD